MEVDSHDWEEFESFRGISFQSTTRITDDIPSQLTDSLPKNSACVLLGVTAKDGDGFLETSKQGVVNLNDDLKSVDAEKLFDCCFPDNKNNDSKTSIIASAFSKVIKKGFSLIENDRVWKKVVGNFGTLLPIDWQASRARELREKALKLSEYKSNNNEEEIKTGEGSDESLLEQSSQDDKQNGKDSTNLDLENENNNNGNDDDDDEEVQQAFDMHSLILSTTIQQEPLFTAEQVISEIEEMMMEESVDHLINENDSEDFALPPIIKRQGRNDEVHYETLPLKKPIIGDLNEMTVLQLCELYDELECIVREYSECLIQELARRDELEYDKELKNQFISLFLSLQRKKRAYLAQEKKNKSRPRNQPPIDHASKVYLTTTIPYDHASGPPTSELLDTYVKILKAMDDESPNLPMLLTEYILKVVCPT